MMLCRIVFLVFVALWVFAFILFVVGTFGWFGQERDPLSGIYLVLLGSPWAQIAGNAGLASPLVGGLAPGVNLLILFLICRFIALHS